MKKLTAYAPLIFAALLILMLSVSIAQAAEKEKETTTTSQVELIPQGFAFVTVHPTAGSVMIRWGVFEEAQGSSYTVEWADSKMQWHQLAAVADPALAGTVSAGRWMDDQPQEGLNYYRIRQVAADGTISYSRVVTFIKAEAKKLAQS